jgi:hypothetical protein
LTHKFVLVHIQQHEIIKVRACEGGRKGYILINTRTKKEDAPKLLLHDEREMHREKPSKRKRKEEKREST